MLRLSPHLITNVRKVQLNQKQFFGSLLLLVSLSTVNLSLYSTRVSASETANKSTTNTILASNNLTQTIVSPHQLVFLAYQGRFVNHGIPSYGGLINAYNSRKTTAKDLVNAAIKINILPANYLTSSSYLNKVDYFLMDLGND
jgi:hypothetical protein